MRPAPVSAPVTSPTVRPAARGSGARAGAVDQALTDDAGRVSPALLKCPPGCRDPGKFRDFPVVRFGVLDDLVLGVFGCRGDVLEGHFVHLWGLCSLIGVVGYLAARCALHLP